MDDNKLTVSKKYYGSSGTVNHESDPFLMFALNTDLNKDHELLLVQKALDGYSVKQVTGCYKNQIETSYLAVLGEGSKALDLTKKVQKLAMDSKQESILVVNSERDALLWYLTEARFETIGKMRESNPAEAIALGNWTLDGSTFWIVD